MFMVVALRVDMGGELKSEEGSRQEQPVSRGRQTEGCTGLGEDSQACCVGTRGGEDEKRRRGSAPVQRPDIHPLNAIRNARC